MSIYPITRYVYEGVPIVGVTFNNRQEAIHKMELDEVIQLVREPNNAYDPNAIQVKRLTGEEIGYIPRYMAEDIAPLMDVYGPIVYGTVSWLMGVEVRGVRVKFEIPTE